jgi:hypothetical protein
MHRSGMDPELPRIEALIARRPGSPRELIS